MSETVAERSARQARRMVEVARDLSIEKDSEQRLTLLLEEAMDMTSADGGTLYILDDHQRLRFEIMHNRSLGIRLPDSAGQRPDLEPIPLRLPDGSDNRALVAAFAALQSETVNIPDAYEVEGFDFSGTRRYDLATGYRSRSFLTVPLRNHEDDVIGVLQLINALNAHGEAVPFSDADQSLIESLAAMAALILTNLQLIEAQKELFESFIRVIANAIDEKNPHTSQHCQRLPVIADLIARAVDATGHPPFQSSGFSDEEFYELGVAAWMHDCGKITTPEHVINKATKLEGLFDRIEVVEARYEILRRDARIDMLEQRATSNDPGLRGQIEARYRDRSEALDAELAFLREANRGGEFMAEQDRQRVSAIASRRWLASDGTSRPLLDEAESENLRIQRGTLTGDERAVINRHIDVTIRMLESLTYPKQLNQVAEIAGGHHEHMDGTGYPRGLRRDQLSLRARIMGIADIFEALTAADRPYKSGKKLSEALQIMGRMRVGEHIDPDLFDLFVREQVYLQYARKYMNPDQIDAVDHAAIPGYAGD